MRGFFQKKGVWWEECELLSRPTGLCYIFSATSGMSCLGFIPWRGLSHSSWVVQRWCLAVWSGLVFSNGFPKQVHPKIRSWYRTCLSQTGAKWCFWIFFAFCKRSLSLIGKRSERTYKASERSERTYRAHALGQQLAYNAEDEGLAWTVGSHTPSL